MTTPSIEVVGSRDLRKALRRMENGVADIKAVNARAAKIVEDAVRPPRRSGRLAASVRSSGQQAGGVVRAGRASVPYAGVIHFGWRRRNIAPQPFLYDALDDRRQQVIDTYEGEVQDLARRHGLT